MIEFRPEVRLSSQIWTILLGFRLFYLDLAHFAQSWTILPGFSPFCLNLANFSWIWAILLGFGPYSLDLGPKGDKALSLGWMGGDGRMEVRMDGQTDSPCVLQDFVPSGPLPKSHWLHCPCHLHTISPSPPLMNRQPCHHSLFPMLWIHMACHRGPCQLPHYCYHPQCCICVYLRP